MKRHTAQSIVWGAGGALALTLLVFWLSERVSRSVSVEPSRAGGSAELAQAPALASAPANTVGLAAVASAPGKPLASALAVPVPAPVDARDEASLMVELRRIKDSHPTRAVELARLGNERFPDSPDAPERASIVIHALAAEGQPSQARAEAENMVNHYPDSAWVREIEQFTGAHRHRNVRVNAEGQLEYY